MGCYYYYILNSKVFVAKNGIILERVFISKRTSGSIGFLEEIQVPQNIIEVVMET